MERDLGGKGLWYDLAWSQYLEWQGLDRRTWTGMSQRQTKSPCHGGCYSHLRLAGVAGASRASRWCDSGKSLVQLGKVAGATQGSRWCDFGAARGRLWRGAGADEKSSRKSAHIEGVDVNACSSYNIKQG